MILTIDPVKLLIQMILMEALISLKMRIMKSKYKLNLNLNNKKHNGKMGQQDSIDKK